MFRRPAFWIVFGIVSAGAALFAWRNFSAAFPLVSIDIRMDRTAALNAAGALATQHGWPPSGFDQAASFSAEQEVQNFVELEAGGKDALRQMIRDRTYAPYTWLVRNFKEGDPHEVSIRFTPEGEPYGFAVKLPEQEAGANLEAEAARTIAEQSAVADWHVDFSKYPLAESSQQARPGGRRDHTFVYERQDQRIGEGRYRLRLVVAGDRLTQLAFFVQVPEAFTRRYAEMRAENDAISLMATVGVVLYLLGFCGVGLFFMMRQRWLVWRPAIGWGFFISALASLAELNSWPLIWMSYDTALPASGFALRQMAAIVGVFFAQGLVFSVSFMAAETLSRRAFPNHIQFWKVWTTPVAASRDVLGRTLAGYLTVSLSIAYVIAFYAFTQNRLGWWTPSDTLVNPDLFASYLPSFSAFALSAQAGFWEECLFRAVPLATFALVGERFGKRRAFLIAGFIVQALIFGSGHAGYANQPSYARVIELVVPSFVFAGFFIAFGLLPGIIMHYTFDAVLMSLPIFAGTTPRAHIEQVLAVLLILIPLGVVLVARLRTGRWIELPAGDRNRAWTPAPGEEPSAAVEAAVRPAGPINPAVKRLAPVAALAGLALWAFLSHFTSDAPPLPISRASAEAAALQAVKLDSSWTVLSRVEAEPGNDDRFVWQETGPERYASLMGTFLSPPSWLVRFARFQGDVAERAEEFQVFTAGDGRPFRVRHMLPEARPGPSLSDKEARALGQSGLQETFQISSGDVEEISAVVKKRPARVDWTLEFKDKRDYGLEGGEPRLAVEIAGDLIADVSRYVHIPEEWERNERRQRNLPDILRITAAILTFSILFTGAVIAAVRWSRGRGFSTKSFMRVGGLVLLINLIAIPNNWKSSLSGLTTSQPYALQVGGLLIASLLTGFVTAAALGLAAGLVVQTLASRAKSRSTFSMGLAIGILMGGLRTLIGALGPSRSPLWGDYGPAGASVPWIAAALAPLTSFLTQTLVLALVFSAVTVMWNRKRTASITVLLIMGLVLAGARSIESLPFWLVGGILIGGALLAVYWFVLRFEPRAVVPFVAGMSALPVLREGLLRNYPAALPGAIIAVILIGLAAKSAQSKTAL